MKRDNFIRMNAEVYRRSVLGHEPATSDEHENSYTQIHDEMVGRNHDGQNHDSSQDFAGNNPGFHAVSRQYPAFHPESREPLSHGHDSHQPKGRRRLLTAWEQLSCLTNKCPDIRRTSNLNITDLEGLWYEIERFPNLVENNMKCVMHQYSFSETGEGEIEY